MHIIDKKINARIEPLLYQTSMRSHSYNYIMIFRGDFPERCDRMEEKLKQSDTKDV